VAFGLPADEALKAVTINAAEIWGAGDRMGSIEKGKWADLIISDGDPLDATTQIKAVFMKGKEVEMTNKQIRLYEKYLKPALVFWPRMNATQRKLVQAIVRSVRVKSVL